jgi:3-dehydroquinate dehydratase II
VTERVLVLNGPNLGMLGRREPHLYGTQTLADIEALLRERAPSLDLELRCEQSNHEGRLIDILEEEHDAAAGAVVNFGALTHTSIALRDALTFFAKPVIEVHLTNIHARERFRHRSRTAAAATAIVAGLGADGYMLALAALARIINRTPPQETTP